MKMIKKHESTFKLGHSPPKGILNVRKLSTEKYYHVLTSTILSLHVHCGSLIIMHKHD